MAAGTAYARSDRRAGCDSASLFTATSIDTAISDYGFVFLHGYVKVNASNGATINNTQDVSLAGTHLQPPPLGAGALANATGNIGVNIAAGPGNVQNNSLAVSATADGKSSSKKPDGKIVASDQNCQTAASTVRGTFMGSVAIGAGALAGAGGNIGVNIAVGAGNLRCNGLAIASVSH
jgi:hypothetical protein